MRALLGIAPLVVLALGCGKQLNPDYCLAHPNDPDCVAAGLVVFDAPPACTSATCTDPNRPVCDPSGACVGCLLPGDCKDPMRPVCANNACVGCRTNGDCTTAGTVCLAGACIPEADVAFVAPDSAVQAGADCSQSKPCSLAYALGQTTFSKIQLTTAGGTYTLGTATTISRSLDLSAPAPAGQGPGMAHLDETKLAQIQLGPGLTIASGTVSFAYVAMTGSTGDGVTCAAGAKLAVEDAFVTHSARAGIVANGCTLDVERTRLHDNAGGAIAANDAMLTAINDFIYKNGTSALNNGAVFVTGTTTGQIRFDTVAYNTAKAQAPAVDCRTTGAPLNATDNLVVQNSGDNKAPMNTTCNFTRSYFGADTTVHFVKNGVDLHLTAATPAGAPPAGIRDVSDADCGDVPVDVDGDVRPTNTFCDLGGDEYVPPT